MKAYKLFSAEEAAEIVKAIKDRDWAQGRANLQKVPKHNRELEGEAGDPELSRIMDKILDSPLVKMHFVEAVSPIKFNRYGVGDEYGIHSDA